MHGTVDSQKILKGIKKKTVQQIKKHQQQIRKTQ